MAELENQPNWCPRKNCIIRAALNSHRTPDETRRALLANTCNGDCRREQVIDRALNEAIERMFSGTSAVAGN